MTTPATPPKPKTDQCPDCLGVGSKHAGKPGVYKTCPKCRGIGRIPRLPVRERTQTGPEKK